MGVRLFPMCLRTLRCRVLVLAGLIFGATVLTSVSYVVDIKRFDRHVRTFADETIPRHYATNQLEDWSFSILSGLYAFSSAGTVEELRTAYTAILADIVEMETAAANPHYLGSTITSLRLNRLIEALKHSLNTTLALKAEQLQMDRLNPNLSAQIAINEAVLFDNLQKLRASALENRGQTFETDQRDLHQLKTAAERDGAWAFGGLLIVLLFASIVTTQTILRLGVALNELGSVLSSRQSGFSHKFYEIKDEFSHIGERIQRYIKQEQELREARDQIVETKLRAEAYEGAIANLTHDLRTPASQVSGLLEQIEKKLPDNTGVRELKMAKGASRRLSGLIQDVLDLTRAEMVGAQVPMRPFNPREAIKDLVNSFEITADARKLDLEFHADLDVETVLQDDQHLLRVLANLIDNAIKYTNRGGVSVKVWNTPVEQGRSNLLIEVRDSGIGIPQDQLDTIFSKFERAKNHYAIDGLGLGLAIVAKFTELLGGHIDIQSEVSRGTTVTVEFPCEVVKTAGSSPVNQTPATGATSKPNVLLVDDDPFNLELALAVLDEFADVTCARDGQEAASTFENDAFDLVIMDCRMPVLDGYAATEKIRAFEKSEDRQETPIWGLTANASSMDREKGLGVGMQGLLPKPITATQVREMLSLDVDPAGASHMGEAVHFA